MPAKPASQRTPRGSRVTSPARSTRARTPNSAAKPSSKASSVPPTIAATLAAPRPPLPIEHANELFGPRAKAKGIKTQDLNLDDGVTISIVRTKVPVPEGTSAHIVRRLDTGAISASSLFRVSFPLASAEAEQAEMTYLAATYDTKTAGDLDAEGRGRLTGLWVPVEVGQALASEYGCAKYAADVLAYDAPATKKSAAVPQPVVENGVDEDDEPKTPRTSKRKRLASPSVSTPARPATIEVTQTIVTDPITGERTETTAVKLEGSPTRVKAEEGSEALTNGVADDENAARPDPAEVAAAIQSAKDLVESLKHDGALQDDSSSSKKRSRNDEDETAFVDNRSRFARIFGRRTTNTDNAAREIVARAERQLVAQPVRRIAPPTRTKLALATAVLGAAAATIAPYLLS